ncbi:MAG: ABC transporter ATP-binding protein [Candidatus Dormibacteraceae bacterium]
MSPPESALSVANLTIRIRRHHASPITVVDDVTWSVAAGGRLGIVGESGSGKTMTTLAVLGLLPRAAEMTAGTIRLDGRELNGMSQRQIRGLRGKKIAMVPQDPFSSLDPSFSVGDQLAEPLRLHRGLRAGELEETSVEALARVRISEPRARLRQYSHQLSGGIRQRVVSAIALAGEPSVLIADEPTTALDVTTQAQYLQLLRDLQSQTGFALVLISHDLLLVQSMCDQVVVMYAGQVVESGSLGEVFGNPRHPYTRALIGAIPMLRPDHRLESIEGMPPGPDDDVQGCRFAPRCKFARSVCHSTPPALTTTDGSQRAARCWGTEPQGWITT